EEDVVALGHLVPLDDLILVYRAQPGHDLLIFDPLAGGLVHLVELDRRAAPRCREQLDRDRDQSQTDLTSPNGTRRHISTPNYSNGFNHCVADSFRVESLSVRTSAAMFPPREERSTMAEPPI